jgi:hypothetical protein
LGEDPPEPEPEPEPGGEPEPEPEPEPTPEPEPGGEPEPEPELFTSESAQNRINKLTLDSKESQRKLDLMTRLGREGYYKVYPDEKPAAAATPDLKPKEDRAIRFSDAQSMVIDGGQYAGMTLGDVYKTDPMAAQDMYLDYRDEQRASIDRKAADESERLTESQTELNSFSAGIAKEMFDKTTTFKFEASGNMSSADLSVDENSKVQGFVRSLMDWMDETNRGGNSLSDALYLMTRDDQIADAKSDGAKALVAQLKAGSTATVKANKGSGGKKSGYDAYESLDRDGLAAKIEGMSDAAFVKFSKDAPQSIKDKFADIPWA